MEEYLRKRYLGKEPKKDKRSKQSCVKIHDSEEEDRQFHSHRGDTPLEDDPFLGEQSDQSSDDIPITLMGENNQEIVNLSKESKKKIFRSLNGELPTGKLTEKTRGELRKPSVKKFSLSRGKDRCRRGGQKGGSTGGSGHSGDESPGGDSQSSDFSRHGPGGGSPPRGLRSRNGSGSDSDLSPPRRLRSGGGGGSRSGSGSDSDLSPPRRLRSGGGGGRRCSGSGSDSDLSPPRRLKNRGRGGSRSGSGSGSDSDLSPPRRLRSRAGGKRPGSASSSDHGGEDGSDAQDDTRDEDSSEAGKDGEAPPPWGKGKKNPAGGSPEKNKKQNVGSTIYRDKGGKIISREEWVSKQKIEMNATNRRRGKTGGEGEEDQEGGEKKKKKRSKDSKELEWGSGLVQKEMRKKNLEQNDKLAKKKNIINYEYDSDYDAQLRKMKRKEDPMNEYLDVTTEQPAKATCRYQSPYNRFNILAGYRWDGVVRGNGFEKRRFEALKLKQHRDKVAYLNNVSDL
ncbi:pre-mRNA-splicing factor CWC26, putative [Plasmodium vivax]|uniref:Pre-mRNA-splicing factor CWC26, putative n=1 Tax=Plasmodium vivax TaxID=5855 RepID=A0A1G4H5R5_PLAVI|nr:pre-mRNA-splicing factor CWC26, putative [Plasmodium vivax]